ncbi:MAG: ribulokinase [Flavobacteriaceae bacterium]|nr:ribulokinase [Flavobacteriaceae bacterium]
MNSYVIGVDFGTDAVRALLVDTVSGKEMVSAVHNYRQWSQGLFCDSSINQFRQHPADHFEGLEKTVQSVMLQAQVEPEAVKALTIDTTGSSPIAVNKAGEGLVFSQGFENNPNAMVILWKDHTAIKAAEEINTLAKGWEGVDFLAYSGGIYSSEWFWAKILHIIRQDSDLKEQAFSWMEHCDYLTYSLIEGNDLRAFKRSRCAAGHKAMWHESWGGLPEKDFLGQLDPYLAQLRDCLYEKTYTSDQAAGKLSKGWAKRLGLTTDTLVGVGTFDAHAGAMGSKIKENTLVRVMGTSTCDIMVGDTPEIRAKPIKGICGQVDGSVIPGKIGLEAGQSAFGDALAWLKKLMTWPLETCLEKSISLDENQKNQLLKAVEENVLNELTEAAKKLKADTAVPTALDWVNGRRTPDANQNLKAAFSNISLGTGAPEMFLSLVYAICFGSKKIVARFDQEGVIIKDIIGVGGVARKSPFIMQTLSNVLNLTVKVAETDQAPALGAAIYAAVAGGIYNDTARASSVMGSDFEAIYKPEEEQVRRLEKRLVKYDQLAHAVENDLS